MAWHGMGLRVLLGDKLQDFLVLLSFSLLLLGLFECTGTEYCVRYAEGWVDGFSGGLRFSVCPSWQKVGGGRLE